MALATAAEVKVLFPQLTGTSLDTDLGTYITRAEEALATYCGFPAIDGAAPVLEQATYTMYLTDALDCDHAEVLHLPLRPVVSITSVHDDEDRAYGSSSEVTTYDLDKSHGRLILTGTSTHAWTQTFESIKVIGVFGLTTGSIPEYVKQAVAVTIKANWDKRHHNNVDQVQTGGDNTVFTKREFFLPPEAKQLIAPLVLHERKMSGSQEVRFG